MKLPFSLLKSFLQTELPIQTLAETLTLLGIEVDHIENEKPSFASVIVAEVKECSPHPSADKLQVTQVFDGKQTRQVVCGAPNCRAGLKVALASPGAVLLGKDGKIFRIEEAKLRGVVSQGMLCSADELTLPGSSEGILELPQDMELGTDLALTLWDPVFELSLTPNLGHCFSAYGIARELSAALQIPLHTPSVKIREQGNERVENNLSVQLETPHCQRYMGRWIENVKIEPSPFWMQQILLAAGMNPINNAVDIGNYILLKWGQPLHMFDADQIEGPLVITESSQSEKLLGLDGIERELPEGTLINRDSKKILAAVGIMGADNSAVSLNTRRIFIESAVFDPIRIRKSSRKMGLRTESSQHFEKGVDPIHCETALDEASYWLEELASGKVLQGKIDLQQGSLEPKKICCRVEKINRLLGIELSQTEMEGIFHRLKFKTRIHDQKIHVEVPLFRTDISEEIDLVEEIARIYGYNNIPKQSARCTTSKLGQDPIYLFENELRNASAALGLQEFLNADLISPKLAEWAKNFSQAQVKLLRTIHSKSEEYSILRPTLLPGLLSSAKHNLDRKNNSLSAFEIGRIYFLQEETPCEIPMISILLTGKKGPDHWSHKNREVDFYDLKGIVENLLSDLQIPSLLFRPSHHLSFHPGRQADLYFEQQRIGSLGEIHPSLLEKAGIEQRVLFAELNIQSLMPLQKKDRKMNPLPQFPSSERDWTVTLPLDTQIETLFSKIRTSKMALLESVELIDLYYPETSGQKNATFRFTYRDPYKTISFEEVEKAHHQLLEEIGSALTS